MTTLTKPKGPDLSGPFSQPMAENPQPLLMEARPRSLNRFEKRRKENLTEPEDNAAYGRSQGQY